MENNLKNIYKNICIYIIITWINLLNNYSQGPNKLASTQSILHKNRNGAARGRSARRPMFVKRRICNDEMCVTPVDKMLINQLS